MNDSKIYRKILVMALKPFHNNRWVKQSKLYQIEQEDLGASKFEVKFIDYLLTKIHIDSGSNVNIMIENMTHVLE